MAALWKAVHGRLPDETDVAALSVDELETRRERAHLRLADAGAHYVIDGIWSLPKVLEDIEERLAGGEQP